MFFLLNSLFGYLMLLFHLFHVLVEVLDVLLAVLRSLIYQLLCLHYSLYVLLKVRVKLPLGVIDWLRFLFLFLNLHKLIKLLRLFGLFLHVFLIIPETLLTCLLFLFLFHFLLLLKLVILISRRFRQKTVLSRSSRSLLDFLHLTQSLVLKEIGFRLVVVFVDALMLRDFFLSALKIVFIGRLVIVVGVHCQLTH